jgi:hypothetical protein
MDDSMATPLSKLPPPRMQSRGDNPPIDTSSVNYSDLASQAHQQQQQQQEQYAAETQMTQPVTPQYAAPSIQQQPLIYPQYPASPLMQMHPMYHYQESIPRREPVKSDENPRKIPGAMDVLKNKTTWITAALVFVLLVIALPKLKTIPALINPSNGQYTLMAYAGMAIITASGSVFISEQLGGASSIARL